MASIDKTYTSSYKKYKEFKDWADKQVVRFFDGHKERVGDYVWCLDKSDFNGDEIPIMNSPVWLDAYLIQNCKIKFVLERMVDVYDKEYYNELKNESFGKIPDGYKQNRKVLIQRIKNTKYPIHNKVFIVKKWWLQCQHFSYNSETNIWVNKEQLYPNNTNTSHHKTVKSVVRHLRKQYLPSGLEFLLLGGCKGENYKITII